MSPRVTIQTGDFDLAHEVDTLRRNDKRIGAVCTFTGTVRDRNMAPTLPTACGSLPPGGDAAPVARQSRFHGPGLPQKDGAVEKVASASDLFLLPQGEGGDEGVPECVATLAPGASSAASDTVLSMELEHYPGMTEKAIEAMIDEAMARFDIFGARVVHRVGLLQPLDQVVLVAVTSAHRGESFKACEFLMDYLKTQAPFWKKEATPEGARWVDARVSDDAALARWGIDAPNA